MSEPLRWGILGTGNIANQFAAGLREAKRSVVAAVGSRTAASAAAFAQKYALPESYASYDALLRDAQVEAVYLSLPNALHHEWTIKALNAGKHVLCEKPLATNLAQAQEMFDVAQRQGRVLVEAFMYRSHPQHAAVMEHVTSGAIGPIKVVRTSFCYLTRKVAGNVRFSAELAGGALMDIGCYCVNLSRAVAGCEPDGISVMGKLHETGVDEIAIGTLHFPNGMLASFTCGMSLQADNTARILGQDGYIEIPVPWKPLQRGAEFVVARGTPPRMDNLQRSPGPVRQVYVTDAPVPLYALEADDFAAVVRDGAAPTISAGDSLGNQRVLDELRRQMGLSF